MRLRAVTCALLTGLLELPLLSPCYALSVPERPLIFIPGLLGSTLETGGDVVWGDAFSLKHFRQLKISPGPKNPTDGLVATGAIRKVQILGPLKIKQYDALFTTLDQLGYIPNQSLFVFSYDWRQSNFVTAEQLAQFVETRPELRGKEFDILAHSMGGLVATIYSREYDDRDGKRQIRRLVTMGTPFMGSAQMVYVLVDGWGMFPNWLAGGMREIRETVLSFPSTYQLMPTYLRCCVLGSEPNKPSNKLLDILSSSTWKTLGWDKASSQVDPAYLQLALNEAAELRGLVGTPTPEYIKAIMIAGDKIETPGQFYVQPIANGDFESSVKRFVRFPGDGTVLVKSATFDHKDDALTSLSQHATIFEDENIQATLERIFGPSLPPLNYNARSTNVSTTMGEHIAVEKLSFTVPAVVSPGSDLTVLLEITAQAGEPLSDVRVTGELIGPDTRRTPIVFSPGEARIEGLYSTVPFLATAKAPQTPGISQIRITNKELPLTEYVLTLSPPDTPSNHE